MADPHAQCGPEKHRGYNYKSINTEFKNRIEREVQRLTFFLRMTRCNKIKYGYLSIHLSLVLVD